MNVVLGGCSVSAVKALPPLVSVSVLAILIAEYLPCSCRLEAVRALFTLLVFNAPYVLAECHRHGSVLLVSIHKKGVRHAVIICVIYKYVKWFIYSAIV